MSCHAGVGFLLNFTLDYQGSQAKWGPEFTPCCQMQKSHDLTTASSSANVERRMHQKKYINNDPREGLGSYSEKNVKNVLAKGNL